MKNRDEKEAIPPLVALCATRRRTSLSHGIKGGYFKEENFPPEVKALASERRRIPKKSNAPR